MNHTSFTNGKVIVERSPLCRFLDNHPRIAPTLVLLHQWCVMQAHWRGEELGTFETRWKVLQRTLHIDLESLRYAARILRDSYRLIDWEPVRQGRTQHLRITVREYTARHQVFTGETTGEVTGETPRQPKESSAVFTGETTGETTGAYKDVKQGFKQGVKQKAQPLTTSELVKKSGQAQPSLQKENQNSAPSAHDERTPDPDSTPKAPADLPDPRNPAYSEHRAVAEAAFEANGQTCTMHNLSRLMAVVDDCADEWPVEQQADLIPKLIQRMNVRGDPIVRLDRFLAYDGSIYRGVDEKDNPKLHPIGEQLQIERGAGSQEDETCKYAEWEKVKHGKE